MKLITVALVCLLVAGMWLQDVSSMSLQVPSSICCFRFMRRKIHKERIKCYKDTSSLCSHQRSLHPSTLIDISGEEAQETQISFP
ncbi:C-C motif chemokine 1 [Saccopteryx leptura]|uniref:C-C motif chemokine 1 n=1 Tax=Saccopteryx leptura TaxID=249018 RepID=UPI00339BE8DA